LTGQGTENKKTAALLAPPKFREETSKKQGAEAHLQDAQWPSQVQHAMGVLNNCASTLLGGFVGKSGSAVDGGMVSAARDAGAQEAGCGVAHG